jgi:hypothetical protein
MKTERDWRLLREYLVGERGCLWLGQRRCARDLLASTMAANGAVDGRGAEKNGVQLRKVFAGIEIMDLRFGQSAGAELVEAGFQVGDVLTKVDNATLLGDETSCAQVLSLVADGHDGVGRAFVEGFRRVPGFPRPTRNAVSGHVARSAFSDNPTHEAAGDDTMSSAAHSLVGQNLDPEVAAVLSEVTAQAEFMSGTGPGETVSGPAVVYASRDSFTSAGYGSDKTLSGDNSLYQTADSKSQTERDGLRGSWRGQGASRPDASWDPRRPGDDDNDFGLKNATHGSNSSVDRKLKQVRTGHSACLPARTHARPVSVVSCKRGNVERILCQRKDFFRYAFSV